MSGVQMSGVQMSDFISKIGHLDPRFYSLIYCDTGGPDVGGPDVGGPDVTGVQMLGVQMSGVQMSDSYLLLQFLTYRPETFIICFRDHLEDTVRL